jgi:translation initiation factor 3 subunit K
VKAAFTRIGSERLATYLDLMGQLSSIWLSSGWLTLVAISGSELEAYVSKLDWTFDASTGVIGIPPNPDNQIESVVVQESIKLPRTW